MADGALVVLSPLLLDNADHLALGLLNHCSLDVEQVLIDIWLAAEDIIFATEFAHLVQLEDVSY